MFYLLKFCKYFIYFAILLPFFSFGQQIYNKTIIHDNQLRDYKMYVPPLPLANEPIPLVFCFHGYGGNANSMMLSSSFNYIADTAGFIVVYPQGLPLQGTSHWNVGGWTTNSTVDDVGFVRSLLDTISYEYNIDSNRVYSTGMSNGGYMSFLLACQLSDKITAIASVTGSMTPQTFSQCSPERAVPILQIHGTNDQVVPYLGASWSESINQVLLYWTSHNNCDPFANVEPLTDINPSDGINVERKTWLNGDYGVETEHLKVYGGGHTWFGISGNMDINASIEVWRFFLKFKKESQLNHNNNLANNSLKNKTLIRLSNVFGQDIFHRKYVPLIYIYDNGEVRKKMVID